ncbi:zf-CCHC domain-containing protein [Tanacetum coccineum]
MMSFLTTVVTSRYPSTNNQLRTSSNPRQQATIYDGKVTVQHVQGRQTTYAAGTTRKYTPGASGSNTRKQRTVICYNCKREGHIVKQCTKPKRKRDEMWFNDKMLLVQAQASDNATYSASAEEIAVQFCFFDIQLTKCLSPRKLFLQKCFSEYQGIRQSASENAGCLKPDPLDSRALGACFIHTKLSIEGRLFLDDLDQRTLPAEQLKPPPFF